MSQPREQRYTDVNLANQGYRYFPPLRRITREHSRRSRWKMAAPFPRYIFVIFDMQRGYRHGGNGAFSIQGLACERETPPPVRQVGFETLVLSRGSTRNLIYQESITQNERAGLISGPFTGTLCIRQRVAARSAQDGWRS